MRKFYLRKVLLGCGNQEDRSRFCYQWKWSKSELKILLVRKLSIAGISAWHCCQRIWSSHYPSSRLSSISFVDKTPNSHVFSCTSARLSYCCRCSYQVASSVEPTSWTARWVCYCLCSLFLGHNYTRSSHSLETQLGSESYPHSLGSPVQTSLK